MAIALGTSLAAAGDTANGTSYTTASLVPGAGRLVIAVVSASATTAETTCTLSGGGVTTWAEETALAKPYNTVATANRKIWVFRAQQTSYSASAAATITLGTSSSGCAHSIFDVSGALDDIANNGAACIINRVTNASDTGATSGSVTLGLSSSSANRPVSAFSHLATEVASPATSWTEIADVSYSVPANALETQIRTDAFSTAAAATWATSVVWGGVAFELVAASVSSLLPQQQRVRSSLQAMSRAGNF